MDKLLEVKDLKTYFYTRAGVVKAVDGVSFDVHPGKTLGIVGESGSGKSVTMMSLLGLLPQPPGKVVGGTANFRGVDLLKMRPKQLRQIRGTKISMIFQDPMTSLNPYLKISTQLTEVLTEHSSISKKDALHRAIEALEMVGIPDASARVDAYPHQFSGGMRQRVMIAMALIGKPDLLIADEPTTALDVTIQAQILELLKDMQAELKMAVILITHDLGVVAGMSDEVVVMYAGRPVERGSAEDIFYKNRHPYTAGLLKSIPRIDQAGQDLYSIPGLPPDPSKLPPGCPFASRCENVMQKCSQDIVVPSRIMGPGHVSVCHLEARA
jgi:oligopeptide transport system ATP-binding protein